jgi:hypothetical protein
LVDEAVEPGFHRKVPCEAFEGLLYGLWINLDPVVHAGELDLDPTPVTTIGDRAQESPRVWSLTYLTLEGSTNPSAVWIKSVCSASH